MADMEDGGAWCEASAMPLDTCWRCALHGALPPLHPPHHPHDTRPRAVLLPLLLSPSSPTPPHGPCLLPLFDVSPSPRSLPPPFAPSPSSSDRSKRSTIPLSSSLSPPFLNYSLVLRLLAFLDSIALTHFSLLFFTFTLHIGCGKHPNKLKRTQQED